MQNYLITMVYLIVALLAGFTFPRFEIKYFPSYLHDASVGSALATLGAIASGTMSLTAIIFSIAYITVQFNAIAYSPRLALWYALSADVSRTGHFHCNIRLYALDDGLG